MNTYTVAGIFIVFVVLFLLILKCINPKQDSVSEDAKHFVRRNYLMTVSERKFYDILVSIVDGKYHVIPQVVLSNVVSVNKFERNKFKYRNKINRYILDFVLFEKPYFTPHTVIELDDTSHLLPERESRDDKVNAILEGVGVRVVHIRTAHEYDRYGISNMLG